MIVIRKGEGGEGVLRENWLQQLFLVAAAANFGGCRSHFYWVQQPVKMGAAAK